MAARNHISSRPPVIAATLGVLALAGCTELPGTGGPQADYYSTRAQARIYVLDTGAFEVVPLIGAEGAAYWCAASEYARLRLGAGYGQDIFVVKGRAPSTVTGRVDSITFSLEGGARAEGAPFVRQSYSFKPGDNFSVSSAESFCRDIEPFIF